MWAILTKMKILRRKHFYYVCFEMSFVFEYFGWTDDLITVGTEFDNSRDRESFALRVKLAPSGQLESQQC